MGNAHALACAAPIAFFFGASLTAKPIERPEHRRKSSMPAWKRMHLITRHFCLIGRLSLGLLTIFLLTVGSSSMAKVITTTKNVEIGDNVVRVRSYETKGLRILFVALHDNEDTGIRAAHNAINTYGGRLIELGAINQRWIPFNVGERRVLFDPNWMFSVSGAKKKSARL